MVENELLLKVCMLGSPKEINTKLLRALAPGKFTTNYLPTLGVDITTLSIQVEGVPVKLFLVDTAGQEFFGKLRPSYYRGASIGLLTFDKSDRASFQATLDFFEDLKKYTDLRAPIPCERGKPSRSVDMPLALIGIITNGSEISFEEGRSLADQLGMSYYEWSITEPKKFEKLLYQLVGEFLSYTRP